MGEAIKTRIARSSRIALPSRTPETADRTARAMRGAGSGHGCPVFWPSPAFLLGAAGFWLGGASGSRGRTDGTWIAPVLVAPLLAGPGLGCGAARAAAPAGAWL